MIYDEGLLVYFEYEATALLFIWIQTLASAYVGDELCFCTCKKRNSRLSQSQILAKMGRAPLGGRCFTLDWELSEAVVAVALPSTEKTTARLWVSSSPTRSLKSRG